MKPFHIFVAIGILLIAAAILINNPVVPRAQGQAVPAVSVDPCNSNTPKTVNVINKTASSIFIANSPTLTTYVCYISVTINGTTPSIQFIRGSGAVCATGQANLSGVYLPTVGAFMTFGYGGAVFSSPPANDTCMVLAGAGVSVQGEVTFVQGP